MADWDYLTDEELDSPAFDVKDRDGTRYTFDSDGWSGACQITTAADPTTAVSITAPTVTLADTRPNVTVAWSSNSLSGLSGEYLMFIKLTDSAGQDMYVRVGGGNRFPTFSVTTAPS